MKVAMLGPQRGPAGVAGYCADLVTHLCRHASVDYVEIPAPTMKNGGFGDLADLLNSSDIVHLQYDPALFGGDYPEATWAQFVRGAIRRPLALTIHRSAGSEDIPREAATSTIGRDLIRRTHPDTKVREPAHTDFLRADALIVLDSGQRDALASRGMLPSAVHVIPPGAPKPSERPDLSDLRRALHLEGKRILYQRVYGDNYRLTSRIMQELEPDVVLLLAGSPGQVGDGVMVDLGKAGGRIVYYAPEDIAAPDGMALADIVLASGDIAGGPRDVLHALSLGIPTVAPATPPYRDIQTREPCLRLVRPGDGDHLAACVRALLHNAIGRDEMAERGRRYAARYGWDWVAAETISVYHGLLSIRSSSAAVAR